MCCPGGGLKGTPLGRVGAAAGMVWRGWGLACQAEGTSLKQTPLGITADIKDSNQITTPLVRPDSGARGRPPVGPSYVT